MIYKRWNCVEKIESFRFETCTLLFLWMRHGRLFFISTNLLSFMLMFLLFFSSAIIARITIVNYKNKLTIDLQWHYTMLLYVICIGNGTLKSGESSINIH